MLRVLQVFHLDVANVLQLLHTCFQVFLMCFWKCFRRILRGFQLFRMYVASVSSKCFKSSFFKKKLKVDQDAPHVAICPTCHNLLLQSLGRHAYAWGAEGWSVARRWAGKQGDGGRGLGGPRVRVGSRGAAQAQQTWMEAAPQGSAWSGGEGRGAGSRKHG